MWFDVGGLTDRCCCAKTVRLNEDELSELMRLADPDQDGNVSVHPCEFGHCENTCFTQDLIGYRNVALLTFCCKVLFCFQKKAVKTAIL